MSEPVVQASPDRVSELAALLGRAFTDDPMLVWPFGENKTDLITDFFRAFDEQIAVLGWLWETGPRARRGRVDPSGERPGDDGHRPVDATDAARGRGAS
jgi:hypothetical protein